MVSISCSGCRAVLSTPAPECPHCGHPHISTLSFPVANSEFPESHDALGLALGALDDGPRPRRWPAILSALLFPAWLASLAAMALVGPSSGMAAEAQAAVPQWPAAITVDANGDA